MTEEGLIDVLRILSKQIDTKFTEIENWRKQHGREPVLSQQHLEKQQPEDISAYTGLLCTVRAFEHKLSEVCRMLSARDVQDTLQ